MQVKRHSFQNLFSNQSWDSWVQTTHVLRILATNKRKWLKCVRQMQSIKQSPCPSLTPSKADQTLELKQFHWVQWSGLQWWWWNDEEEWEISGLKENIWEEIIIFRIQLNGWRIKGRKRTQDQMSNVVSSASTLCFPSHWWTRQINTNRASTQKLFSHYFQGRNFQRMLALYVWKIIISILQPSFPERLLKSEQL
jgi:hypothetical protein